jgi:hypothetical protein
MLIKVLGSLRKIYTPGKTSIKVEKKKFAFVHIPKTAGMTMSAILEQKFPKDQICPFRLYPDLITAPREELSKYVLFRGHFPYDVLSYLLNEPFTCITILREPVARYYSYYKFMKKREDFQQFSFLANEVPLIRKMDFKEFTTSTNMVVVKDGLNQQCRYLGKKTPVNLTLPYTAEKQGPTSEEIERAKTRLANMEAFGLAERFQDSLFLLSFTFGWKPIKDKLILNTTDKSDPLEISEETRALVEEKNKPDVELFEFAKTLFETKYQNMLATLVKKYGKTLGINTKINISQENVYQLLEQNANAQKN